MTSIGIDPGSKDGALVLLSGRDSVLSWLAYWTRDRTDGRHLFVSMAHHPEPREVASLHLAVTAWRYDIRSLTQEYRLVCEALFVHREAKRQSAVIPLAETVGELLGPLRDGAEGEVERPLASQWRPRVLGLARNTNAEVAERQALKLVPHRFGWPGNGWRDVATLPRKPRGAVAEAACIAAWR